MKTLRKIHVLESAALLMFLCLSPFCPARGDEGTDPPPIPRTKPISHYTGLVSTMLPSFDGALLSVPNGPNWMAGKTVHQVAVSVLDSDPGTIVAHGSIIMGYDPPNGPRYVKLDFSEGYIRYTNRNRSFHTGSPCTAVSASEAENGLVATLGALGLPTAEWSTRDVNTVMERSVDGEGQDPPTEQTCEIEQMVSLTRKISNGYPVFSSGVRESISNLHERARLLIDWPQFVLETGLIMRTRAAVVTELAQRIWEAESGADGLGAEVELEILLGYEKGVAGFVPVARTTFADIYNRYAGQVTYVPLANNPSSEVESLGALATIRISSSRRRDGWRRPSRFLFAGVAYGTFDDSGCLRPRGGHPHECPVHGRLAPGGVEDARSRESTGRRRHLFCETLRGQPNSDPEDSRDSLTWNGGASTLRPGRSPTSRRPPAEGWPSLRHSGENPAGQLFGVGDESIRTGGQQFFLRAESPRHGCDGQSRRAGGLDVDHRIAHHQGWIPFPRACVPLDPHEGEGPEKRSGIRLAHGKAVAAEDHGKESRKPQPLQDPSRQILRFVGYDRHRDSRPVETVAHFFDPRIRERRVEETGGVGAVKASVGGVDRLFRRSVNPASDETTGHEHPRAATDVPAHLVDGERAKSAFGQHHVHARGDVLSRLDKGSVEIEEDGAITG